MAEGKDEAGTRFSLSVSAEDINKMLVDAVMSSKFGESMKSRCEQVIRGWEFKQVAEDSLKLTVTQEVRKILDRDDMQELIRERVRAVLTDDAVKNIVDSIEVNLKSDRY